MKKYIKKIVSESKSMNIEFSASPNVHVSGFYNNIIKFDYYPHQPTPPPLLALSTFKILKASALCADAFYKSICPSVCLSVGPSVCPCVHF